MDDDQHAALNAVKVERALRARFECTREHGLEFAQGGRSHARVPPDEIRHSIYKKGALSKRARIEGVWEIVTKPLKLKRGLETLAATQGQTADNSLFGSHRIFLRVNKLELSFLNCQQR